MIVALAAADREAAVALWEACGLTRPWNDPRTDFDRAFDAAHAVVLGAIVDGALVGTVMAGEDGHRGWLYYLGVLPAARSRGVGAALVAAAETWLAARRVPKVELMVRDGNDAAARLYTARGYERAPVTVFARTLSVAGGTTGAARG